MESLKEPVDRGLILIFKLVNPPILIAFGRVTTGAPLPSIYSINVCISNRRLIAADDAGVAFRWKDYRIDGPGRWKTMRLHPHEFIRRFLLHVLPTGFHRIRHYGLFASANRADNIATARAFLDVAAPCRRPTTALGYRAGCTTPAALPMPALRRPHDRH